MTPSMIRQEYGVSSIDKVLEEVQLTKTRELEISANKNQNNDNEECTFRRGIVHLLKDKFSQLSYSNANETNSFPRRFRSKSVDRHLAETDKRKTSGLKQSGISLQSAYSTTQLNGTLNSGHDDSKNSLNSSQDFSSDSLPLNTSRQTSEYNDSVDNTPELVHSSISTDKDELHELPIKNIVAATRCLFEKFGSEKNNTIPRQKSALQEYSPINSSTKSSPPSAFQFTYSRDKQDNHSSSNAVNSLESSPNLTNGKISLDSKQNIYNSNLKNVSKSYDMPSHKLNSENAVKNETPSDISPAKDYAPLTKIKEDKTNQQAHSYVPRKPLSTNNSSPITFRDTRKSSNRGVLPTATSTSVSETKVSSIVPKSNVSSSEPSTWKTWDDIPAPPKRKTFIDEARHVEISPDVLKASRQTGKSWLFTTDSNVKGNGSIAIQVKPSLPVTPEKKSNEANNGTSALSKERQAQQTFWDSYRTEEVVTELDSELAEEARRVMNSGKDEEDEELNGSEDGEEEYQLTQNDYPISNLKGNQRRPKKGLRIQFVPGASLEEVFEYQSEDSFLAELGIVPEYERWNGSLNYDDPDEEEEMTLKTLDTQPLHSSTPPSVTKGSMATYQSKIQSDFSWGVNPSSLRLTRAPVTENSSDAKSNSTNVTKNSISPSSNERASWSATADSEGDMLF